MRFLIVVLCLLLVGCGGGSTLPVGIHPTNYASPVGHSYSGLNQATTARLDVTSCSSGTFIGVLKVDDLTGNKFYPEFKLNRTGLKGDTYLMDNKGNIIDLYSWRSTVVFEVDDGKYIIVLSFIREPYSPCRVTITDTLALEDDPNKNIVMILGLI